MEKGGRSVCYETDGRIKEKRCFGFLSIAFWIFAGLCRYPGASDGS
jgi:hypothetical protein